MNGDAEPGDPHERAFEKFARRATDRFGETIDLVILFGSAARGETRGIDSDVDIFIVVTTPSVEDELRDLAYDVQLEFGVVLSLHVTTVNRFQERSDHPFVKNVLREGRAYA